jgi:YfiR/HmsC-like
MKRIVLLYVFALLTITAFGQTQNYQTHTLFMYSFTRFIQWPPEESQGDFEIVVLGESPIFSELKVMAERKRAGSRVIHVSKINSMAEYKKGHILYIGPDWSSKFQEVSAKIGEDPVLLVTEQAVAANKGSVNFVNNKDGKLAFELNRPSIERHRLKVSAELTRLAITNVN